MSSLKKGAAMPLNIVQNDITKMEVDAIVNAANTSLRMGSGVCGAIFRAAGSLELQAACDKLSPIKTGEAVITPGFALPAKYIIHAAGPIYRQWSAEQNKTLLRAAYTSSLEIAAEYGCSSIAFPLISSGVYGYPKAEALQAATEAIQSFLSENDINVWLVIFGKEAFVINEELLGDVARYIEDNYIGVKESKSRFRQLFQPEAKSIRFEKVRAPGDMLDASMPAPKAMQADVNDLVGNLGEPFSTRLLQLIDAKGKSDPEIYKRANIDRKLFSKIRNPDYSPSKKTALALSIALELTLDETSDLLERAGFALSRSQKFDVIVEYFITHGKYDIYEINNVLFEYGQPLLGG